MKEETYTYTDSVSGKTLYVQKLGYATKYYKDKECRILHREDGPAVYYTSFVSYYQNGKLHRMNGSAVEGRDLHGDEIKRLYVNDVEIDRDYLEGALKALKNR